MKSILRTLVAVVAAISVMSTASTALAKSKGGSGWLTQGAEILPKGTYAFEVRTGWPSTDFGVHIPVLPKFEITPFLTLDYLGYNIQSWNATFGNTFGVQLKGQVWKQGPHAISLGADLGIAMNYLGFFDAAFQIGGPELKYSHRWDNPRIAVIAGLRMPIRVWFRTAVGEIPILWNIGFEYNVIRELNIHANLEFGPAVVAVEGGSVVAGHVGFQFGISYLF